MLIYTSGAVFPLFFGYGESGSGTSSPAIALKATLNGLAIVLSAYYRRVVLQGMRNAFWIVALLLLALASTLWSQNPSLTLQATVLLTGTTLFGIYLGTRYTVQEQLRLLALTCGLVILSSYIVALLLPHYGLDQSVGYSAWQGVFIQKNGLAQAAVLSALVFWFAHSLPGTIRVAGGACSVVLLLFTRSATSLVVFTVLIALLPVYSLRRIAAAARCIALACLGLLIAILTLVIVEDPSGVLHLIGRTPDMTGRLALWEAVSESIAKRPWLGYGFSAFWQGMTGESAIVLDAVGWMAGYSHNGFLDLVLHTGVTGLAVFGVGYALTWVRAVSASCVARERDSVWICTYLSFLLAYNLTEGSLLTQNSLYWALYAAIAARMPARGRLLDREQHL